MSLLHGPTYHGQSLSLQEINSISTEQQYRQSIAVIKGNQINPSFNLVQLQQHGTSSFSVQLQLLAGHHIGLIHKGKLAKNLLSLSLVHLSPRRTGQLPLCMSDRTVRTEFVYAIC